MPVTLTRADGSQEAIPCRCRIDTATELTYYRNDGILHYVIRNMLWNKGPASLALFGYSTGLFCRLAVQQMAHLGGFGVQIVSVFRVTPDDQRHPLHNVDPGFGKNFHFFRVIG